MTKIVPPIPELEDFDYTNEFRFLHGFFNKTEWKIPFLSLNIDAFEAAKVFNLVSDIPRNDEQDWSVDELFQRDIDWHRVVHEIRL